MSNEYVTVRITPAYLRDLIESSMVLDALDGAGVDNWEGYGEAEWPEDETIDNELNKILEQK